MATLQRAITSESHGDSKSVCIIIILSALPLQVGRGVPEAGEVFHQLPGL